MNVKEISGLELLEQDVWFNFCYYYQCDLVNVSIKTKNLLFTENEEKIIKRMQQNDFPFDEERASYAEMMDEAVSVPFKPFQIAELLIRINTLRLDVNNISTRVYQRQYSNILISYVDVLGTLDFINNKKIARSAKAILAVKARYEKHLYPRREILYRVLREQVAKEGKWDNLNKAVYSIVEDLVKAFDVYDVQWLKSELGLKQEMLKELEQSKQSAKQANVDLVGVRRKTTTASMAKKIEKIQLELKNLNQILKAKDLSKEMEKFGYKMPYSGGYIAETIIHELRNQPEFLQEILC